MDLKNVKAAMEAGKAAFDNAVELHLAHGVTEMPDAVRDGIDLAKKNLFFEADKGRQSVQMQLMESQPAVTAEILANARGGEPKNSRIAAELQRTYLNEFQGELAKREPAFAAEMAKAQQRGHAQ